MQVFHFGSSKAPLLGVYDAPAATRLPPAGVVICAPFGHEYIRAYRTLRNLADALAASGLHVLRFDYSGCGDSAGEAREATIEQWQRDIGSAIDELKDMSALPRVSVVGVRFGATLGALALAKRKDVETLVLWDAVMRGSSHLRELRELQERWLYGRPRPHTPPGWPSDGEIMGFPVPPALDAGFRAVDLGSLRTWTARRLISVTSSEEDAAELRAHLDALGQPCTFEQVASACEWRHARAVHLTLLATEVVERIATFFRAAQAV